MRFLVRRSTFVLLVTSLMNFGRPESLRTESRWHLQRIVQRDRLSARQVALGSSAFDLRSIPTRLVNVYVIDSGILITHEEFARERAIYGRNIRNPEKPPDDCDGHGTHVAAIAVGALSGVASNARAIAVKTLNCKGRGSCSNVLSALEWVAKDSSHRRNLYGERSVAVMSIGSRSNDCAPTLEASKVLWDSGVFIAAAAGNQEGDACQIYPARSPSTVAVGAFDVEDKMYYRNNVGPCVDIFAPGVKVLAGWGANSTRELRWKSGSSMATPIVAAIAAIILGVEPNLTSDDVKAIISSSSTKGKLYEPGGKSLLSSATNEMVYAPWSRLFDELDMDDPVSKWNGGQSNESVASNMKDPDWNSSTSFAALPITFHPRTRPAMLYSVERIKCSISQASGIRESALLARLAAGERHGGEIGDPNIVRLIFYIPMMTSLIQLYEERIIQAAMNGDLQRESNEAISFEYSARSILRTNVTVPAPQAPVFGNDMANARTDPVRFWIKVALLSFGCLIVLVFLFGGALLVRRSMRNIRSAEATQ